MGTISNLIVEFIFRDRLDGSSSDWSMVLMQFTENAFMRALCRPNRIESVVFWIVRPIPCILTSPLSVSAFQLIKPQMIQMERLDLPKGPFHVENMNGN